MEAIQIGSHASFERAAATAVGANSVASYNSNNPTNVRGANIVAINIISSSGGNEPLIGFPNRLFENYSLGRLGPNTSPGVDHTQEAIRCFRIMNDQLQQDILDVGVDPAQFLTNAGVKRLWPTKRDKNISQALEYACTNWAKHLKEAKKNNKRLVKELENFVNKHLLHWIEALSWINKLSSADLSLEVGIAFLSNPTLSYYSKLLFEGQQLISNFGDLIAQTALHIYRTALPLTPDESLLYQRYSREMRNNLCRVLCWRPEDSHRIITCSQYKQPVNHILFSCQPTTYFASWSGESVNVRDSTSTVDMWDSTTGMSYARITDNWIALADNFSAGASSRESSVFFYNFLDPNTPCMMFTASAPVLRIALSVDGRRIAAGSSDGKIKLWDGADGSLIQDMDGFECANQEDCQFAFSPNGPAGARLVFSSRRGGLELQKAINGEHIANLNYQSTIHFNLVFSRSGSRLASLVKGKDEKHILTVWNVVNGALIGASPGSVGSVLAISADGLIIATGGDGHSLQLWSRNRGSRRNRWDTFKLSYDTPSDLDSWDRISCLAFSQDNLLVIGFTDANSVLYDVKQRFIVIRIPKHNPSAASFSLDCTRLAIGYPDGTLRLWYISGFKESRYMSRRKSAPVSIMAFSPDCSRLASGFEDGTVRLWDTEYPSQPLMIHKSHSVKVTALAFRLDGLSFASGAVDGTIRLWDSNGVGSTDLFQFPTHGELTSVAFSGFVLAAATEYETILWDIETGEHGLLCKLGSTLLAFSNPNHEQSRLLASFNRCHNEVMVWDIVPSTCIAQFSDTQTVEKMVFTSDNSQLVGTVRFGVVSESFCLFDFANKHLQYLQVNEYARLCPMPRWHGIPVWLQYADENYTITGFLSEDNDRSIGLNMVVLPKHLVVDSCKPCGSRMFALPCKDGRILFFKSLY
ncbi:hypothetical protein M378DRAFT_544291 [Amanita muscaria Koide BX008]|uniref:Uncharacterized protein n=1 Tax=Amanita muscaria (strain Koide BX008) TaxID=946122 RepID=A0A0C2WTT0_AMAMK|nr:hypothetical protein M378DRAFT_544291 [Amanita muscaria Koide BX008]